MAESRERTREAADALRAKAEEVHELPERVEHLTRDTPDWYVATRAGVEARVALEQAEELERVLEEMGERLGE